MDRKTLLAVTLILSAALLAGGCQSPYHADRGALFGGLLGAGTGAIVGDALGNAGAGAAIGAGLGAITGAAIGSEMDQVEARNRALIAQQLGRQVAAGAVHNDDVVAMTQAGVDDELIVAHVQAHGVAAPLQTSDLIYLQQQGVSTRVIKAMQSPPPRPVVVHQQPPPPVVVQEYHYGNPYYGSSCATPYYGPHHYYRRHSRPRIGVGMSFGH